MNRLQSELHRLYFLRSQPPALIDAAGHVRAMVMELTGPPDWEELAKVWHGVQAELALPAPAIAVSGTDGLQLWFSVEEPIPATQAHAFLDRLRMRFLPGVDTRRVRSMPAPDATAQRPELHARQIPALQPDTGNWSAFVARDLAPVFADTPWLDIPPNEEGQATLLHGLDVMKQVAFDAALGQLAPPTAPSPAAAAEATATHAAKHAGAPAASGSTAAWAGDDDPRRFLCQVMNDPAVALALRIEAAKALLPYTDGQRPRHDG